MDEAGLGGLARQQYGLVSRAQLAAAGWSRHAIAWRLEAGEFAPVFRGVYRLRGTPPSWEQRALAAVLSAGPGAALSHWSAATLFRLDLDVKPGPRLDVAIPRGRRVDPSTFNAHQLSDLPLTRLRGIPVTHVPRTLVDLAAVAPPLTLELALDSAHRLFPGIAQTLRRYLGQLSAYGHGGLPVLRHLLELRTHGGTDSALEVKVWRRLRDLRVPKASPLYPLHGPDGFVAEIDFAWPAHKVALHVDGYRWHQQRPRFEKDARQRSQLAALGWLSLTATAQAIAETHWGEDLVRALTFRAPQRPLF